MRVCLLAIQGEHRLSKLLFMLSMIVHTMIVSKKPESILVESVITDGDRSNVKNDGNLSSSGLDSSESLYTLARSYLMSKFPIPINSLNTLMILVLLVWLNLQCQIFTCLFLLIRYVRRLRL